MKTNPYTKTPYTEEQLNERLDLFARTPIANPLYLKQIKKAYETSDVLIIRAGTGTGKGTIIPPYLMDLCNLKDDFQQHSYKIIIAEPRTENTNVATYLRDSVVGAPIIQQAYRDNMNITESTLLAFVTYGLLVNFCYRDKYLKDYEIVIIDEVHERDTNTDLLLTYTKEYFLQPNYHDIPGMESRKNRKVVILSATMDPEVYRKYYSENKPYKVAVLDIPGVTYPVKHVFIPADKDIPQQAVQILKTIQKNPFYGMTDQEVKKLSEEDKQQVDTDKLAGSAIIFLPKISDLRKGCRLVYETNKSITNWKCYEYSSVTPLEQKLELAAESEFRKEKINGKVPDRKIIFSTNVAESGVTIKGITYVIESGQRLENIFSDAEEMDELKPTFITRSEATQRCGRSGRLGLGICYHLYTQEQWDKEFQDYKSPQILTQDITEFLFKLIYKLVDSDILTTDIVDVADDSDLNVILDFLKQMPTPPTQKQIDYSLRWLNSLNLLKNSKPTELGRCIAEIPLDIPFATVVLCAKIINKEFEICSIISVYQVVKNLKELFRIDEQDSKYNSVCGNWADNKGEIFSAKKIFDTFRTLKPEQQNDWCYKQFIHIDKMNKIQKRYEANLRRVRGWRVPGELRAEFQGKTIQDCFAYGFKLNIAVKNSESGSKYKIDRPVGSVEIEPNIFVKKLNKKIIFLRIMKGASGYMVNGLINL